LIKRAVLPPTSAIGVKSIGIAPIRLFDEPGLIGEQGRQGGTTKVRCDTVASYQRNAMRKTPSATAPRG
jgi:hypothetical protein